LVLEKVQQLRQTNPRMGARKLYILLTDFMLEHQIKMGRDALFDLLASHYMLVRRKRRRIQTTQSGHWFKRYPNLIADLHTDRINQLWVADITYIKTNQGFLYLNLITDACSRKILGYDLANNLDTINTVNALRMAIQATLHQNIPLQDLIHHSDQGFQYCSAEYVNLLKEHSIQISMSDRGHPLQNAIAERINGILKHEYLFPYGLKDRQMVVSSLPAIIDVYNNERPHMSNNMLTPAVTHQLGVPMARSWKNYYKKKETEVVKQ
jgi:putative transposase